MRKLALLAVFLALPLCGCTSWEQTTFDTLVASDAVIDQAQADYESGKIPKTAAAYKAITDAKAAQVAAVNAFQGYETIKAAKAPSSTLNSQIATVNAALAAIPPLITAVQALYTAATAPTPTAWLYGPALTFQRA
jgi:hypothetical protein